MVVIVYKGYSRAEIHNLTCERASLVGKLQCSENSHETDEGHCFRG